MTPTLNVPLPPFLNVMDGIVRVTGTRISLPLLVADYNDGATAEAMRDNYPHIPLATFQTLIAFYLENKPEVDRYAAEWQVIADRYEASAKGIDRAVLRARMDAMRANGHIPPVTRPAPPVATE